MKRYCARGKGRSTLRRHRAGVKAEGADYPDETRCWAASSEDDGGEVVHRSPLMKHW